jgi:anhydro-N-acetylmuramic acid kinase
MLYRAIGLMSGSSLDGLDIVFAELQENAGKWQYEIIAAECEEYALEWKERLQSATGLNARDYQLLHVEYGHYLGQAVNRFIDKNNLHFKVGLVASHGHTTFHMPGKKLTAQLGDGAAIAAQTGLPVVSDLRAMDVAFGGQGAPIVPIGEKLLFPGFEFYLNLGGIANISFNLEGKYIAYDVCPANKVLNLICKTVGKEYDDKGQMAAIGNVHPELLEKLKGLSYYGLPFPKSLANDFGIEQVYPIIKSFGLTHNDSLRTYVEHIVQQISLSIESNLLQNENEAGNETNNRRHRMLVTGGGALNSFLTESLSQRLETMGIDLIIPENNVINYKEALIMGLIGVLRWRQEYNVLSSVTGAKRDSIGGALWIGQEA